MQFFFCIHRLKKSFTIIISTKYYETRFKARKEIAIMIKKQIYLSKLNNFVIDYL